MGTYIEKVNLTDKYLNHDWQCSYGDQVITTGTRQKSELGSRTWGGVYK